MKPMNPSVEEKHMMQISIPLFSPAIARERGGSLARGVRSSCGRDLFRNQRNPDETTNPHERRAPRRQAASAVKGMELHALCLR